MAIAACTIIPSRSWFAASWICSFMPTTRHHPMLETGDGLGDQELSIAPALPLRRGRGRCIRASRSSGTRSVKIFTARIRSPAIPSSRTSPKSGSITITGTSSRALPSQRRVGRPRLQPRQHLQQRGHGLRRDGRSTNFYTSSATRTIFCRTRNVTRRADLGPSERIMPTNGNLGKALEYHQNTCETPCCSWAAFKLVALSHAVHRRGALRRLGRTADV